MTSRILRYACQAVHQPPTYSFGDDPSKLDDYAWFKKNSPDGFGTEGTHRTVGIKAGRPQTPHSPVTVRQTVASRPLQKIPYSLLAKEKMSLWPVFHDTTKRSVFHL